MMIVRRTIEVEFETRCGDATAAAIVANAVATIEGQLTTERVRGRVEAYQVRVTRPVEEEVPA
jgi:hypothetical protein